MQLEFAALIVGLLGLLALAIFRKKPNTHKKEIPIPDDWRAILQEKVQFYNNLSPEKKQQFEHDVQRFLDTTIITGVGVDVTQEDKLLVASGAVIPVLAFSGWEYAFLHEVILYPDLFTRDFRKTGPDRLISGMVGSGAMEGKMILSKKSLHLGFDNRTDKKNVAVHEFVHLVDKQDGAIDGIPKVLLEEPEVLPWLELVRTKMEDIVKKRSGINHYGASSTIEFLPVVAEHFFERPKLLKKKHPELYNMLCEVFGVEMV